MNAGARGSPNNCHWVRCRRCRGRFDVFAARWCGCARRLRTRRCPLCGGCLCDAPESRDPACWVDAPERFRRQGFDRVPVYYL